MEKTRSIDFATLSLRDALDLAGLVEEEARERYEELADQMEIHHNPEAARFFRFMVDVEGIHQERLVAQRHDRFGDEPVVVRREMIFDIEAPEYDEVRATMSVRQALEAALRSEEKAHAFFDAALARVADPEVRALFTALCAEELEHQGRVKKELAKLAPDAELTKADIEDDPVAL